MPTPKAFTLLGPTACGKTALALKIAETLPVEIISLDSALLYTGMDIGTAKPSASERAFVPHHLIDIITPVQTYSAARFVEDCTRLTGEITARGKCPLIVGGTMMYFRALTQGLNDLPEADACLRAENPCQFVRCAGTQAAEQGQYRDAEDEVAFEPDVASPGFAALEDFPYRAVAEGNFGVCKAVSRREQTVFCDASRQFQPGNVQGQCFACKGGKFRAAVRALQNQAVDDGEEGGHIF